MAPNPTTTSHWTLQPKGTLSSLTLHSDVPLPDLKPDQVLVSITAISLNYRDVGIPQGNYPLPSKSDLIPCSDASGIILSVGSAVTSLSPGSKICTVFNPAHQTSSSHFHSSQKTSSLGSLEDGILRRHLICPASALVPAPESLSARESASLPCAAVTAYNCLFGLEGKGRLKKGQWVLTQGTGGVSLFAVQFARATGARVVATTSSTGKVELLKGLGADHVVNYREDKNWGETVKGLTDDGEGVHHVVEVGGEESMVQSLEAVRCEGVISIVGFLGGGSEGGGKKSGFADTLRTLAIVRGVHVGSRELFLEMNAFIEEHAIRPVLDEARFDFEDAPKAFEHLWEAKHVGKVVIDVNEDT